MTAAVNPWTADRIAHEAPRTFTLSIYGRQGSGKTFTALLIAEGIAKHCGKEIAFLDTERDGSTWYLQAVPERKAHPAAFDFRRIFTQSLAEAQTYVKAAIEAPNIGIVVVDSFTLMWDAAMASWNGDRTKIGSIPMHAWGPIKAVYKPIERMLLGSDKHVILCGRQRNIFEDDPETGEKKKVGVEMRAESETAYEPQICVHMMQRRRPGKATITDYEMWVEKDRSGLLAGLTYINPTYEVFRPIIERLGTGGDPLKPLDEIAEEDSTLHHEAEEKRAKREEKSRALFADFTASIQATATLEELLKIRTGILKEKRHMLTHDVDKLREIYEARRNVLATKAAGEL